MRGAIMSGVMLALLSSVGVIPAAAQTPAQMEQIQKAIERAKEMQEKARQAADQRRQQQQQQQQQRQQQQGVPGAPAGAPPAAPAGPPAASAAEPLSANVQTALMGPWVNGGVMSAVSVSEDGGHVAIIVAKGSRQVMTIDGVEGPVFDEIPKGNNAATMAATLSPAGGRSAYVGRRSGDYIAVIDGKEAGRVATSQNQGLVSTGYTQWSFWFNHDGTHLAYAVVNDTGSLSMMVDGVKSPTYRAIDLKQVVLKGKRLAYVTQSSDNKWHVVVDGKPGAPYDSIESLQMTPGGAHYAFFANRAGGAVAVLDGVEGKPYASRLTDMLLAPDGRLAYMAVLPAAPNNPHAGGAVLVVGGQEIPNVRSFGVTIPDGRGMRLNPYVAFSPDGKRFAYVRQNVSPAGASSPGAPSPGVVVVVDGKPGLEYQGVNELQFSPDGKRFFYVAQSPSGMFPVIDGQELQAFSNVMEFRFSPDGKRYSFKGQQAQVGFSIWVDGKEEPRYQGASYANSFTFSPDGRHYAYGAQNTISSYAAVVDGVLKPGYLGNFVTTNQTNPPVTFPPLVYSPDSTHLAYVGQSGAGKAAIIVDGVAYEGASQSFLYPAFSPDSKHFSWINTTGKGWTVFIDEKMGPTYDAIIQNVAATRFTDDHTFRFYGVKDNQIYRVTVDLGM